MLIAAGTLIISSHDKKNKNFQNSDPKSQEQIQFPRKKCARNVFMFTFMKESLGHSVHYVLGCSLSAGQLPLDGSHFRKDEQEGSCPTGSVSKECH